MYHNDSNKTPSPVCNFVPSYSSYDGIGGSLAGGLSNFFESIIRLLSYMRW